MMTMDESKLRQLWQRYIVNPPSNHQEGRICLKKLLDICIVYFQNQKNTESDNNVQASNSLSFKTTRTCIGNWLIHQFIIDLSNVNSQNNTFESEYELLKHYFVNDIGWKLLKCIYYFSANDSLLYNFEFIKILVVIMKTYLTSSFSETDDCLSGDVCQSSFDINTFIAPTKFNDQAYQKTLKNDILSLAKVKSWIKCSRSCTNVKVNNKKSTHSKKNRSDSDDEDYIIPRHMLKYSLNNSKLYFLSKTSPENMHGGGSSIDLQELCNVLPEEYDMTTPTRNDILNTIDAILIEFINYEHKCTSQMLNSLHTCKLSFLVIEKLCVVLNDFLHCSTLNLSLLKPLKNLMIASSITISRHASGVQLIHNFDVIGIFVSLINLLNRNITNCDREQYSDLHAEYYETISSTIMLLSQISQHLQHTEQFAIFQSMMSSFFSLNIEEILSTLVDICEPALVESGSKSRYEYDYVYHIVDSLQQLQITWQYSQSLHIHKHICNKKRHNKCDLAPFMAHHFYHLKLFSIGETKQSISAPKDSTSCISSLVYHALIKLIFICSKRNTDCVDKLICHISNHLCFLIACCSTLRRYFKHLLYFALNSNRSNSLRGIVFNIIEFSIKIQRRHQYNSMLHNERCTFCNAEEMGDSSISTDPEEYRDSVNSEGYLTDNTNYLLDKAKVFTCNEFDQVCPDPSCLIKSLSLHYINLLKCENLATRQTVFRHFFNLFSYLSCSSKESILSHIILPIFQNYHEFTSDVCLFILRLFIIISDSKTTTEDLNLLQIFVKNDSLPLMKQMIMSNSAHCSKHPSIGHSTDRSILGICLLENLIKKELTHLKGGQYGGINDASPFADSNTIKTIPILIDLFLEQFDACFRINTMQHFENYFLVKPVTLASYISFYQKTGFNIHQMNSSYLINLYDNLHCLLKLLDSSNSILTDFIFFGTILNHESFGFSDKLVVHFQQMLKMIVREIKLFRLLVYEQSKWSVDFQNSQNDNLIDTNKYVKFFSKIFKILEQLLLFMLQLESSYCDNHQGTSKNISNFIQCQLNDFIDDENLLNWNIYSDVDPVLELLKILINIAFNNDQELKCYISHIIEDLLSIDTYHPRTSSFDSLMSDNDATIETTEFDYHDYGYDADTEGLVDSLYTNRSTRKQLNSLSFTIKHDLVQKSVPILKHMEICQIVIDYLGQSFSKKLSLCNNVDFTSLKFELNSILVVINLITKICKENNANCKLLFEQNFTSLILNSFKPLLACSNLEDKSIKFALFDLFIEISKVKLRPQELRLLIDLFKQKDSDYEFLMSILHKLFFSKHFDLVQPQYSVKFPVLSKMNLKTDQTNSWFNNIITNINYNSELNQNDLLAFKSLACVLPLFTGKTFKRRYSMAFWIYLDRIQPLIDKFKAYSTYGNDDDDLEFADSDNKVKNNKLIHIISMAFHSSTVELWFDYVYNRFVYRVCKENNGQLIYGSENYIANSSSILGKWNFVRVNFDDVGASKNRGHFLKIAHSINCSKDKIVKLSYFPNLFNDHSFNNAVLIGSSQAISQFHYRLGNVFVFTEHLKSTSTIFLYSLGADFSYLHHLRSDSLVKTNYLVIPKLLVRDSSVDIISSMLYSTSSSIECKFLLDNIILQYRASDPKIYFTFVSQDPSTHTMSIPFTKMYTSQPKSIRSNRIRESVLYGTVECETYYGLSKTVADSGGISVFLFMFLYLLDKCEDQFIIHKSMELVLRIYDSNYYHRLIFDTHYNGYRMILYALENQRKASSSLILRIFSQFCIDYVHSQPVILSSNIDIYISSWKVWIRNLTTMRLFFSSLHSLTTHTNPYRNFNLFQLRKADIFKKLLYMIEDIYVNLFEDVHYLDTESINQIMAVFKSLIDSSTDLQLIKSIFNCILLLHKSECLHINQSKSSFYYLFPSTWLSNVDIQDRTPSQSSEDSKSSKLPEKTGRKSTHSASYSGSELSLNDWEIVSELVDCDSGPNINSADANNGNNSALVSDDKPNCDYIVTELLLLIGHFLDQTTDVSIIEPIFNNLSYLDFLLVFVNNPSDRVREAALSIFFKFHKMFYSNNSPNSANKANDHNQVTHVRNKKLHLLLVSNQLFCYNATEELFYICTSFLLDLNKKTTIDLLRQENNKLLKISIKKVTLESFIPFLAILSKCLHTIGFCFKVLKIFHRILDSLSVEQIGELQKQYGLIQSITKVAINLNTQVPITYEDINKFTKEHVNEEIYRIVNKISFEYVLKFDAEFFDYFIDLTHYFSVMERKVDIEISTIFRRIQIAILQSAFEAYLQIQNLYQDKYYKQDHFNVITDQFFSMFSSNTLLNSDVSGDMNFSSSNKEKAFDLISPKEMLNRLKFIVKKSVSFIVSRDDVELCQKERYFQREVLFHILDIIHKAENIRAKSEQKRKEKNPWINTLQGAKEYFKTYLCKIVLFLLSPLQKLEDRIFSLHLFTEKTHNFEFVGSFIEKNNDKFIGLFDSFVRDLSEQGVTELDIYSLQKYSENSSIFKTFDKRDTGGVILTEFVMKKFQEQTNRRNSIRSSDFNKTEIANWFEDIEKQKVIYEQSILKHLNTIFENMSQVQNNVLESSTYFNDQIIFAQHFEKKSYMDKYKEIMQTNEMIKTRLIVFANELLHEKAFWHLSDHFPQSWALSPFESSNRIRKKLERCFLEIDNRFVANASNGILKSTRLFSSFLDSYSNPICFLVNEKVDSNLKESSYCYTNSAKVVLFDEEIDGEIIVSNNNMQFLSSRDKSSQSSPYLTSSKKTFFQDFVINFSDIQELTKCRYELQNNAMEVFLSSGLTYLIAFQSKSVRDECIKYMMNNRDYLPNLVENPNLVTLTQMWRERRISNFEYLTHLNKLSGRTFNDLMQYPVFPFVLADYKSDILNLRLSNSFRILSRPIAVQKKEREKYYINQYNYLKKENNDQSIRDSSSLNSDQFLVTSAPYHYGAHYSNSGIVLYYLVRLPPYTQMFLKYQDNNFDIPDRSFHSIYTTWRLATEDSTNGFKELIPEFFYMPEFLINSESFNFGIRQNGEQVDDVKLPVWCRNNARLFTLINRQALESNFVTQNLNHWIDLIFGYMQKGKAAVDAVNVFHPATHCSVDLSKIKDDLNRHALKTMIKTLGQMPNQLFNMPHPTISPDVVLPLEDDLETVPNLPSMGEVVGLKWGNYVGSPIFPKPKVCLQRKFKSRINRMWALPTNDILLLPENSSLFVNYNQQRHTLINNMYIVSYSMCTWSSLDSTVWIKSKDDLLLFTEENQFLDQVSLCESIPDYDWLLIGYKSGNIVCSQLQRTKGSEMVQLKRPQSYFIGHQSPITSISINKNYSIALSTDLNGLSIVWDMNKLQYLRTIKDEDPKCCLKLSTISDTLGDLAIVGYTYSGDQVVYSKLMVYTINGSFIGDITTERDDSYITSVCYSTATEGISINVIATGHSNGDVKLWSSWDLTSVREIQLNSINCPITSITYSFANDLLYIATEDNGLLILENNISTQTVSTQGSSNSSHRKNFRLLDLTDINCSN